LSNLKVDQLGFVFKDIEKQGKILENLFNIPKFTYIPPFANNVRYRGRDVVSTTKRGFSRNFNTQIEIIQHIEGENIYKEFLDEGREGLHHISLFVENMQSYLDKFQTFGYEVVYSGKIGKQNWAYLDTERDVGFLIELQETLRRRTKK
jgi:hypothetical protein